LQKGISVPVLNVSSFINYNGEIVDSTQPVFSSSNRAFRYGDAVFETIRLVNGEILFLDKHLARLKSGMEYLGMQWHDDFNFQNLYLLMRHLDQVNHLKGNGRIRMEVFREDGGYYTPVSDKVFYLIEAEPLAQKEYGLNEQGLKLEAYNEVAKPLGRLSNLKSSNALWYVMAAIHKQKMKADDCIILNSEGNVAEAISSNVFAVVKGDIVTPALSQGCVSGVMREVVIELLKEKGKAVIETRLSIADLLKADELFLTNVIDGIRWAGALREKRYFNTFSKWLAGEIKSLQVNKVV
jgi:branched-subunit amino acid aminotransferase/4-amino-4-deoxychorismate lyase